MGAQKQSSEIEAEAGRASGALGQRGAPGGGSREADCGTKAGRRGGLKGRIDTARGGPRPLIETRSNLETVVKLENATERLVRLGWYSPCGMSVAWIPL